MSGSSDVSSASAALSSQNADLSSRLSSLNAAASTATGSARSSYSSQAVVLQSSASVALQSASSALSSAASRISSEALSASAAASSSADSPFPSSSAAQSSDPGVIGSSATATATAPSSATSSASSNNNNDDTPPPSVLAGGIVGGVAGLAVLVLTAMVFLRWYRKRMASMNSLTGAEAAIGSGGAGGMSERGGRTAPVLAPLLGGVFKNRKSRAVEETTGERGFQRISGRKLPSAFSAGMTSAPRPMLMPSAFDSDRNMSTTSVYRDSTYYGAGGSPFDDPDNEIGTNETIMPGPARQARVHPPYAMSPTSALSENTSPTSPTFPIQGYRLTPEPGQNAPLMNSHGMPRRSVTPATMASFDGSRGSRFTEEV